ncbi:MAG: homoserine kinase [Coriobacteriia bacterium]|nr:homoserine kinase [Coriobacteriia bacterium]MCL2746044.1 homoserine kinase [Coriobacteriia bacterium]MCL2870899.1 homoserine kinase [Coriobacteriia bacterium]
MASYQFSVGVPATTANLGPGYDSFGLALELRNDFHASFADEWNIEITGEGLGTLTSSEDNLVAVAMRAVFAHAGKPDLKARILCDNKVPLGSGLGSSSSALVGGGVLARRLLEELDPLFTLPDSELLGILSEIEGHPDNIAPALMGGFTICWKDSGWKDSSWKVLGKQDSNKQTSDGTEMIHSERFELVCPIAAIIVPSTGSMATSYARGLLPEMVSHETAAFNLSHAGLLAAALVSGRADLLQLAMKDRLHHPYRLPVIEDYYPVKEILMNAGTDAVALSGAGPTIIGFVSGVDAEDALIHAKAMVYDMSDDMQKLGTRLAPIPLPFAKTGALITDNLIFQGFQAT